MQDHASTPTPITLTEAELRKAIEEYYLPRHLVRAIYDIGHIPAHSQESHVGVGFIDIADYTYLSKFLSPKENQILLNGLYTAFQMVLERHGGYLNKIEGDSMMFHFDGIIDKRLWNKGPDERISYIGKELFFTCVEMQRVCVLFNQANDRFLDEDTSETNRAALLKAFDIINTLRNKHDLSSALHAFFQIRIRIGANIGEVTIGNFGPDGSKHWDVIGLPVINAKRMESTAPVGGLRISEDFYKILDRAGVVVEYHERFKREAAALGSVYRNISREDLFTYRQVTLREKKGESYRTYSVQVNPGLPEVITRQVESLLEHGRQGADRILEFLQYYRGNRYVIDRIEELFEDRNILLRKQDMLELIHPKRYKDMDNKTVLKNLPENSPGPVETKQHRLYEIFRFMDRYQDLVQKNPAGDDDETFVSFNKNMQAQNERILRAYEERKFVMVQRTYFFEVVYPLVYMSIRNSILEYQHRDAEPADLESLSEDAGELEELGPA